MMGAVAEEAAATLVFLGKVDERTGAVDDGRTTLFDDKSGVAAFFTVGFFSLPASTPVEPFLSSAFDPPDILVASFPPERRPDTKCFCFGKGEGDCLLTLATSLLSKLSVLSPFTMLCLLLSLLDVPDVRKENRLEGAAGRLPASSKRPFFFFDTSTSSLLLLLTTSKTASSLLLFLLSSSALLFLLLLVVVVVSVLSLLIASSLFLGKLEVEWLPT